jgi:polysaccharide deacetylase family protein (PEP-CTERM system associated)
MAQADPTSPSSGPSVETTIRNVLTIDVEEYFHPTEFQSTLDQREWTRLPTRIDGETKVVLDLLDAHEVKATFFILGWVALHHGALVREIVSRGHEIGCHSHLHQLVYELTPAQFREDTRSAVSAIEDSCGLTPRIYRAPSYSITRESFWALETLIECGFTHDSSVYPISHDRYGIVGFERHAHVLRTPSGPIQEIPIATVLLANGHVAPIGGGGYLRLLPYRYASAGIRRLNRVEGRPACIYFHPWEIDPEQPRLASGLLAILRTYTGMRGMRGKIQRLLTEFRFAPLTAVYGERAVPDTASDSVGEGLPITGRRGVR